MTPIAILLLTQEDCTFCDLAKSIMDRLAQEFPIAVSMLSLATPLGQQTAQRNGILFAPGIILDGQPFSYGRPSERKLRRAIAARLAQAAR